MAGARRASVRPFASSWIPKAIFWLVFSSSAGHRAFARCYRTCVVSRREWPEASLSAMHHDFIFRKLVACQLAFETPNDGGC